MTRFRGPAPDQTIAAPIESLVVLYHRPSGQTHLLAQPLPEVLAGLSRGDASLAELLSRLGIEADADATEALAARMSELEALGLVDRVA